jgi:hypothetical protein
VKICLSKSKWCPKSKVKVNVLNLNDKVKIIEFLKGCMALVRISIMEILSICDFSSMVSSLEPKHGARKDLP